MKVRIVKENILIENANPGCKPFVHLVSLLKISMTSKINVSR
jgi:hypothetical protein